MRWRDHLEKDASRKKMLQRWQKYKTGGTQKKGKAVAEEECLGRDETIREGMGWRGAATDRVLWEEWMDRVILSPVEQIGSRDCQRWNFNVNNFKTNMNCNKIDTQLSCIYIDIVMYKTNKHKVSQLNLPLRYRQLSQMSNLHFLCDTL